MATVACLLADGFDDFEFRGVFRALEAEGYLVEVLGAEEGRMLHGLRGEVQTKVTQHINKVVPGRYHAVFIPGGTSAERLAEDPRFAKFVNHMAELNRPIFAMAEGVRLLLDAGLLRPGCVITAPPPLQERLRETGAEVLHQPIVVDGSRVTARQTTDLPRFCETVLDVLEGLYPTILPPPNRTGADVPRF